MTVKFPVASAPAENSAVSPAVQVVVKPIPVETPFQFALVKSQLPDGVVPPAPDVAPLMSHHSDCARAVFVGTLAAIADAKAAKGIIDRRESLPDFIAFSPAPGKGAVSDLPELRSANDNSRIISRGYAPNTHPSRGGPRHTTTPHLIEEPVVRNEKSDGAFFALDGDRHHEFPGDVCRRQSSLLATR